MTKSYKKEIFKNFIIPAIIAVVFIAIIILGFMRFQGNKQIIDLNNKFTYAYIELPGGQIVEGKVESWNDYNDGDQIQVTINGKVYLTDSTRCVLIKE